MSKKKTLARKIKKKQKLEKKRNKIVKSVIDDMITEVEETANPTDYFNIIYLTTNEINFIINIDNENVSMLNNLHVEKIKEIDIYSVLFVRKNKTMDLNPWIYIEYNEKNYIVSKLIIEDIRNNTNVDLSDEDIAEIYIKNNSNVINTIVNILDPELLKKNKKVLTEEQKKAKYIRDLLAEKNTIFNNRMNMNRSINKNNSNVRNI